MKKFELHLRIRDIERMIINCNLKVSIDIFIIKSIKKNFSLKKTKILYKIYFTIVKNIVQ